MCVCVCVGGGGGGVRRWENEGAYTLFLLFCLKDIDYGHLLDPPEPEFFVEVC